LLPDRMPVTGNTELTNPENRASYPALDGLRALAFLMVFFHHYFAIPWGWSGVNVFFVLSGFLITGILYDSRDDTHRARNFYIRRMLRIFPLYYGIFLLILLTDPIFRWRLSLAWFAWPLYIANFIRYASPTFLIHGSPLESAANAWLTSRHAVKGTLYLGHFWSLCVEEQFYLVWPWIVFSIRSRRVLALLCGLAVIFVPVLRLIAQHDAPAWMLSADLLFRATPFQMDSLLLGGLVALLLRGRHSKQLFEIGTIIVLYGTFAALVLLFVGIANSYPNWRLGFAYPSWTFTWGLSLVNLYSAGIILSVLRPAGPMYHLLSLRPLRWLGRISYGAYVFHDIFHNSYAYIVAAIAVRFKFFAGHAEAAVLLLGLSCTVLISWLSFRYYESRFLNLKERWTIRAPRTAVAASQLK